MSAPSFLAFDYGHGQLVAAVVRDGRPAAMLPSGAAAVRGETLVAALRRLMAEAGLGWHELALLAVTVGPGSFTGIRAAVGAARALALAAQRPVLPLGSLEVIVATARLTAEIAGPVLAVTPGRRGEWYAQPFDAGGEPEGPVVSLPPEELAAAAARAEVVLGPDVSRLATMLTHTRLLAVEPQPAALVASVRCRLEAGTQLLAGIEVDPLYVRAAAADPRGGRTLLEKLAS